MHVHVSGELSDLKLDALNLGLSGEITLTHGKEIDPLTQILVKGVPSSEDFDALSHLERLVIPWAGLPGSTKDLLKSNPQITAYNLHHNAASTAETAIALLLACSRKTVQFDQLMRENSWEPRYQESGTMKLAGKKALVLGYGAIGRKIAQALVGLGLDVRTIKRVVRNAFDGDVAIYSMSALHQLLQDSSVVMIALPATQDTIGIIDREAIGLLNEDAIVVNIARGSILDEEALFEATSQGKIFGVGLDVWWNYPSKESTTCTPGNFPWHELENVVMSPHVGGAHQDNESERMTGLRDLLNQLVEGKGEGNRVDVELGY